MGRIKGYDYSAKRENDYGDIEYYFDDLDEWYTKEELLEFIDEGEYWDEWANELDDENIDED